jgi:hypothetical protein
VTLTPEPGQIRPLLKAWISEGERGCGRNRRSIVCVSA